MGSCDHSLELESSCNKNRIMTRLYLCMCLMITSIGKSQQKIVTKDHPLLPIFHNDKQGWHPIPKESQHYYKNKEKLDYYYYPAEYDYYEYYDELNSIYGPLEPPPASVYKSSENSTKTTTTTEKWIIPPPIAPT